MKKFKENIAYVSLVLGLCLGASFVLSPPKSAAALQDSASDTAGTPVVSHLSSAPSGGARALSGTEESETSAEAEEATALPAEERSESRPSSEESPSSELAPGETTNGESGASSEEETETRATASGEEGEAGRSETVSEPTEETTLGEAAESSSAQVEPASDPSSPSEPASSPESEDAAGKKRTSRSLSPAAEEQTGFFEKDGKTYYRDPVSKKLLSNGVYRLTAADGKSREFAFAKDAALIRDAFYSYENGERIYSEKDGSLSETAGIREIRGHSYVLTRGRVLRNEWYRDAEGRRYFASPGGGRLYRGGAFTVKDGKRYAFYPSGVLALNDWVEEAGYGRFFARPGTGEVYRQGGFTVKDGKRYAFNDYGILVADGWVSEPGYGRFYGRPKTGEVYSRGGFTVRDGKRYAFNQYGVLVKDGWVEEPGYGRFYGRPQTGEVYNTGAFSVRDGKRYVFNRYGVLAEGQWVIEPGFGSTYGAPGSGLAYRGGCFRIKDDYYVFNPWGYLASNEWVYEKNYGWCFADAEGKALRDGVRVVDGRLRLFNDRGYLHTGLYRSRSGECFYGLGDAQNPSRPLARAAVRYRGLIGGKQYYFDARGRGSEIIGEPLYDAYLDVDWISQVVPVYAPNACEMASALSAMRYQGYALRTELRTLIDNAPYSSSPYEGFSVPSMYQDTLFGTIYPQAAVPYWRQFAPTVTDTTGYAAEGWKRELRAGNPVVLWITSDKNPPRYVPEKFWPANLHCVLLIGYSESRGTFSIMDPYSYSEGESFQEYDQERLLTANQYRGEPRYSTIVRAE